MEQLVLIKEAAQLINQAGERAGAGFPSQAQARLVELRELLNNQPELEASGDTETEKTDEASEG